MLRTGRLTIGVFGDSDMVTSEIAASWAQAFVDLMGPYGVQGLDNEAWDFAAAVIDVRCEPQLMLALVDALEAKAIPFLFVVPHCAIGCEQGPFVLSAETDAITHILTALVAQDRGTTH